MSIDTSANHQDDGLELRRYQLKTENEKLEAENDKLASLIKISKQTVDSNKERASNIESTMREILNKKDTILNSIKSFEAKRDEIDKEVKILQDQA